MSFGYSVGDVLLLAEKSYKIYIALQDGKRNSSRQVRLLAEEFGRFTERLQELHRVLEEHGKKDFINSTSFEATLDECAEFTAKYAALNDAGASSTTKLLRGVEWMFEKENVERLRRQVAGNVRNIELCTNNLVIGSVLEILKLLKDPGFRTARPGTTVTPSQIPEIGNAATLFEADSSVRPTRVSPKLLASSKTEYGVELQGETLERVQNMAKRRTNAAIQHREVELPAEELHFASPTEQMLRFYSPDSPVYELADTHDPALDIRTDINRLVDRLRTTRHNTGDAAELSDLATIAKEAHLLLDRSQYIQKRDMMASLQHSRLRVVPRTTYELPGDQAQATKTRINLAQSVEIQHEVPGFVELPERNDEPRRTPGSDQSLSLRTPAEGVRSPPGPMARSPSDATLRGTFENPSGSSMRSSGGRSPLTSSSSVFGISPVLSQRRTLRRQSNVSTGESVRSTTPSPRTSVAESLFSERTMDSMSTRLTQYSLGEPAVDVWQPKGDIKIYLPRIAEHPMNCSVELCRSETGGVSYIQCSTLRPRMNIRHDLFLSKSPIPYVEYVDGDTTAPFRITFLEEQHLNVQSAASHATVKTLDLEYLFSSRTDHWTFQEKLFGKSLIFCAGVDRIKSKSKLGCSMENVRLWENQDGIRTMMFCTNTQKKEEEKRKHVELPVSGFDLKAAKSTKSGAPVKVNVSLAGPEASSPSEGRLSLGSISSFSSFRSGSTVNSEKSDKTISKEKKSSSETLEMTFSNDLNRTEFIRHLQQGSSKFRSPF